MERAFGIGLVLACFAAVPASLVAFIWWELRNGRIPFIFNMIAVRRADRPRVFWSVVAWQGALAAAGVYVVLAFARDMMISSN
jgi:hypothetical protein